MAPARGCGVAALFYLKQVEIGPPAHAGTVARIAARMCFAVYRPAAPPTPLR